MGDGDPKDISRMLSSGNLNKHSSLNYRTTERPPEPTESTAEYFNEDHLYQADCASALQLGICSSK